MAFTRAFEEQEVSPEVRRAYGEIRSGFDLPFVPTVFKRISACPAYLKGMWRDLGPIAGSREFQAASHAFREIAHSAAVGGGWTFSDQPQVLASEKFSNADISVIGGIVGLFARATVQMALFTRLMQRGYSGGQKGRVSPSRQASALSQMVNVHVPNEREAGLRVWLIYSDIKRTTGAKSVMSLYRVLSPFPGYLNSAWMDSKKLLTDSGFLEARAEMNRRARALLTGFPVKDHRAQLKEVEPAQWQEIEETVDGFASLLPQFVLLTAIWQRSFPTASRLTGAA